MEENTKENDPDFNLKPPEIEYVSKHKNKADVKSKNKMNSVLETPQTTTALGIIGILTQMANVLQNVKVGELWEYISGMTYGGLITFIGPLLVYI